MPFDDKELEQLGNVFESALDRHTTKREKAIADKKAQEWKPGDKERRANPAEYGGRRKAPASTEDDKKKKKTVRSIFAA